MALTAAATSPVMVEMELRNSSSPETHNNGSQRLPKQGRLQTVTIVISAASATGIASILSGLMTVILPQVVKDFNLGPKQVLWLVFLSVKQVALFKTNV
jgi:hypothetical protein